MVTAKLTAEMFSTSSQACAEVIEGYLKQLIMLSRGKKEAAASKTTHTTIQYFHFCLTCNICNTNTNTSVFNSCCTACTITKLTLFSDHEEKRIYMNQLHYG